MEAVVTTGVTLPDFGLFEAVVQVLVQQGGAHARIAELSRTAAVFTMHGRYDVAVLRRPIEDEAFKAHLEKVMKAPKPRPLHLVVVGGGPELPELVDGARPHFMSKAIGTWSIQDDGTVHAKKPLMMAKLVDLDAPGLQAKLAAFSRDPAELERGWSALRSERSEDLAEVAAEGAELRGFAADLKKRKPIATFAFAGLIAATFVLQLVVGMDVPPQFMRLGALSGAHVLEGDFYRLLSCTLLHGGFMHVAFNLYVLVVLGVFLERLIGPARLVLLYVVSAFAGSVGSALLLEGSFSVGASGAVWGFLGAHAALSFGPGGLLPKAMIQSARRATMINLGINVLNSFRPNVDLFAHFAGGAAGALLFALLLTRGVPRLGKEGAPATLPEKIPTPGLVWGLAAIAFLLLPASLAMAVLQGKPFELQTAPAFADTTLQEVGVTLALPVGLPQAAFEEGEYAFGDMLTDPMVIGVFVLETPPLGPEQLAAEMAGLREGLAPPEAATVRTAPRDIEDGGDIGLVATYDYPSGLVFERAFVFRTTRLVRVEAYRWPGLAAAPPDTAEQIARTSR